MFRPIIVGLCLFTAVCGLFAEAPFALAAPDTDDPLWEFPEPLATQQDRSEEEEDRLAASAWFTLGRVQFQRQEPAAALRSYQRAWRFDSDRVSILREIVPLAFELKRNAEAARYAVIMAERSPRDAVLLRRLAQHLVDQRDFERGLKLYEKSLALQADDKPDARHVLSKMEVGRLYFITDQHEEAADAFGLVLEALDKPEEFKLDDKTRDALLGAPETTYTLFGEAFLEAERLEDATEMFEKVHEAKPNPAMFAFRLARVDMKNDRPKAALEQLEKYFAAEEAGAGMAPYELYEEALAATHEHEEKVQQLLRERLTELREEKPKDASLGYFLAEKHLAWEEHATAADLYESALEETPTIAGYKGLTTALWSLKNDERLLDALAGAVDRAGSLRRLEDAIEPILEDKKRLGRLIKLAQKRVKAGEQDENANLALAAGLLALDGERYGPADQLLAHAAAADEERRPAIMETWGLGLFMDDQFDRATKVFRQAIEDKVAPQFDADFYYYLAGTLEFAGKTDEALAAAEKAAELDDKSPRYAARRPWVLYHAERYDEAKQEYLDLLDRYEGKHDDEETRDVVRQTRLILSNIEIHADDMPAAEEWLAQVLDEFPEDIGAMNDLGYLWSDQGKHLRRSLRMVTTAAEAEPDNVAYRDSVGWAHFRLGNLDEAVKHLEQAAEGDVPDGVIYDHLGDAYHAAGRKEDAVKAWKQSIELFEKDEEAEEIERVRKKLDEHEQ